jgi:transcriptional regulator with XRE-family HTH domain
MEAALVKKQEKFSDKKMALATIMREELRRREISQSKFAKLMNRHRPEITKWLSGRHNFTLDTLFEIESKLNISFFRYEKNFDIARARALPCRSLQSIMLNRAQCHNSPFIYYTRKHSD